MKPLSEKEEACMCNSDTCRFRKFRAPDVKQAVKEALHDLIKNDYINTNGVAPQEMIRIFKNKFGFDLDTSSVQIANNKGDLE